MGNKQQFFQTPFYKKKRSYPRITIMIMHTPNTSKLARSNMTLVEQKTWIPHLQWDHCNNKYEHPNEILVLPIIKPRIVEKHTRNLWKPFQDCFSLLDVNHTMYNRDAKNVKRWLSTNSIGKIVHFFAMVTLRFVALIITFSMICLVLSNY